MAWLPSRPRPTRALLAITAALAYAVAAAGAPLYRYTCPRHRATHGQQSASSHHATHQAHDAQPAGDGPEREGPCTCLGVCEGTASFALPAAAASQALAGLHAPAEPAPPSALDRPPHAPFTLPYATAPPLSV